MFSKLKKTMLNMRKLFSKIYTKLFPQYKRKGAIGVSVSYEVDLAETVLEDYVTVAHHSQIFKSQIGKRTSVGRYNKIRSARIGRYCSISWDVTIGAVPHDYQYLTTSALFTRKQYGFIDDDIFSDDELTVIGNDVWVGCGAIILSGVTIGDGAVIGAGAVVTKNVDPYEIVAGVPAKHIAYRFDEEIIERLQKLQWYEWSDEQIKERQILFTNHVDKNLLDNWEGNK
ncbi:MULTISPECIES: CatB-related O-acetyltransferase [Eubacteriales]|nr:MULTISPECIES: CatB-related O-acetyltransferase [Eubacteriales]ERJ01126.1 chloramphenicol O-acetyltransferase domain protein [Clostridium sp. ATCC 29733]SHG09268.1 transferase hexapeptide (six repeat-containing protein) [Bittarella massiliensis (ex Durand et al. 2017)]